MADKVQFSSIALFPTLTSHKNTKGAPFTVVSRNTQKDYTFKITRSEFNGRWYTHVRVEKGYQHFVYLGTYFNGNIWRKKQIVDSPSAVSIAWILARVEARQFDALDSKVEFLHLGNCVRCGKPLSDHNSIKVGLGPICQQSVDIDFGSIIGALNS